MTTDRAEKLTSLLGLLDRVDANLQALLGPAPVRPNPPLWNPEQRAGLSAVKGHVRDGRDTVIGVLRSL